jgi:hypothetical protein
MGKRRRVARGMAAALANLDKLDRLAWKEAAVRRNLVG